MAFITIGQSYFIFVGVASAKWWKKHPECSGLTNDKREEVETVAQTTFPEVLAIKQRREQ